MQQIIIRTISGEVFTLVRPADQATRLVECIRDANGAGVSREEWINLLLTDGTTKQLRIAAIESVTQGAVPTPTERERPVTFHASKNVLPDTPSLENHLILTGMPFDAISQVVRQNH